MHTYIQGDSFLPDRHKKTDTQICLPTYIHIYINTHIHALIYVYYYTSLYTNIHNFRINISRISVFPNFWNIHTYIHTYVHAIIYTYIHTHIWACLSWYMHPYYLLADNIYVCIHAGYLLIQMVRQSFMLVCYTHTNHTFPPRKIYHFKIKYFNKPVA